MDPFDDPFQSICSLANLRRLKFKTPGGSRGRPFSILKHDEDSITLKTSTGGKLRLRSEVFFTAEQLLRDLGEVEEEGWVRLSDDTLSGVLRGENRDGACSSYVFPLLEHLGRVEIDRGRPVKLRLARQSEN